MFLIVLKKFCCQLFTFLLWIGDQGWTTRLISRETLPYLKGLFYPDQPHLWLSRVKYMDRAALGWFELVHEVMGSTRAATSLNISQLQWEFELEDCWQQVSCWLHSWSNQVGSELRLGFLVQAHRHTHLSLFNKDGEEPFSNWLSSISSSHDARFLNSIKFVRYLLSNSAPHDPTMFFGIGVPVFAAESGSRIVRGRSTLHRSDLRTMETSLSASSVQRVRWALPPSLAIRFPINIPLVLSIFFPSLIR